MLTNDEQEIEHLMWSMRATRSSFQYHKKRYRDPSEHYVGQRDFNLNCMRARFAEHKTIATRLRYLLSWNPSTALIVSSLSRIPESNPPTPGYVVSLSGSQEGLSLHAFST